MTLIIQTNVAGRISVWIVQGKKILTAHSITVEWHGSDRALTVVDQALKRQRVNIEAIKKIVVVRGPGSFTAVRTGLIIANTLATIIHIPVVGAIAKELLTEADVIRRSILRGASRKMVRPWYGKAPNITRPKPRKIQATARR